MGNGCNMLSCHEVTQLISESFDHPLPFRRRIGMQFHLLICKWCDRFRRQILFIQDSLRRGAAQLESQDLSSLVSLSPAARERIKQVLLRPGDPDE